MLYVYNTVKTAHCGLQRLSQYSSHIYNSQTAIFTFTTHAIPPFDKHYQMSPSSSSMALPLNCHFAISVSICVSRPPALALAPGPSPVLLPSICIYRPRLSICFYHPWHPIYAFLFFDLQLKFVIITLSTYMCTIYIRLCTYFLGKMWEISKLQLFEISSQEIFSIFLIGCNWSHSVRSSHRRWY